MVFLFIAVTINTVMTAYASDDNNDAGSYCTVTFKDEDSSWDVTPEVNTSITDDAPYIYNYAAKSAPTVTAPAAKNDLVYSGQPQALVEAGATSDGILKYAVSTELDSDNKPIVPQEGNYTDSIPEKSDAGTYYVWYKVVGDENHTDTVPVCIPVTVSPKEISITGLTAGNKTYDGTDTAAINHTNAVITDLVSGDSRSIASVTGKFDNSSAGENKTVTITGITLSDNSPENYVLSSSSQQTTTATITRKALTLTVSDQTVGVGGSISQDPSLVTDESGALLSGHKIVSVKLTAGLTASVGNAGKIALSTVLIVDSTSRENVTGNYEIKYTSGTLTVTNEPVAIADLTYNGGDQPLVTAGPMGTTYSLTEDGNYTSEIPAGREVGDYKVYYKLPGATISKFVTAKISKIQLNVIAYPKQKAYGEKDPNLTIYSISSQLVNGDTVGTVLTGILEREPGEEPGTYVIKEGANFGLAPAKAAYYDLNFVRGIFTINKKEVSAAQKTLTGTYNVPVTKTDAYAINISSAVMNGMSLENITVGEGGLKDKLTNISFDGRNLLMDVAANTEGSTAVITLRFTGKYYEDYDVSLTVTSSGKSADVFLENPNPSGTQTSVNGVGASGLDTYINKQEGTSVDVDMTITPVAEASVKSINGASEQTAQNIKNVVDNYYSSLTANTTTTEFLDIKVTQIIDKGEKTIIDDLGKAVEIELVVDLKNKYLPVISREHKGVSVNLRRVYSKPTNYVDGTFYVTPYNPQFDTSVKIYVYSRYYSPYALSYYNKEAYTVTWNDGVSSPSATQIAEAGSRLTKPTNPVRSGYTFNGWYNETDSTNITKWDFNNDSVYGDLTLTARWINNSDSTDSDSDSDSDSGSSKSSSKSNSDSSVSNTSNNSTSSNTSSSQSGSTSSSNSSSSQTANAAAASAGSARPAYTGDTVQTGDEMPSVVIWCFILLLGVGLTILGACKAAEGT